MIKVIVAVMGAETQEIEIADGATVGAVLSQAGFSASSISKVKRNGVALKSSNEVSNGDMLLVVKEKMKGASEEEDTETVRVNIEKEVLKGNFVFNKNTTVFEMMKNFVQAKDLDFADVKFVKLDGTKVEMNKTLVDGGNYSVVMKSEETYDCSEYDDDEEDYNYCNDDDESYS